jgi:hypothetical protein
MGKAVLIFLIAPLTSWGQGYLESYAHPINTPISIQTHIGLAIYSGELSNPGQGELQNNYMNLSFGAGVDYRLTHYHKLVLGYRRSNLASESLPQFWGERSFSSKNSLLSLSLEHGLFKHRDYEELHRRFNLWASLGIGINWYRTLLSDLPQEEPTEIKGTVVSFPLGVGLSYRLTPTQQIALWGTYIPVQSDLLDGSSLHQTNDPNDLYLVIELKYQWQIANGFVYKNHLKRKGM